MVLGRARRRRVDPAREERRALHDAEGGVSRGLLLCLRAATRLGLSRFWRAAHRRHDVVGVVEREGACPVTRAEVGQLYERFGHSVFRRCLRVTGDRSLAEDVLHDVFVRVLRYGNGFAGASVLGWLHRIADRACLDRLDRDGRTGPRALADAGGAEEVVAPPAAEATRFLRELLTALPRALRQIAILYYVDDMDQDEIARVLACSTMTVKRRLAALRERSNQLAAAEEVPHGAGFAS